MNPYHLEFKKTLDHILSKGQYVSPRGKLTLEAIGPYTMGPIDSRQCILLSKERNLNYFFLFAENLWYLSGRNDTKMLSFYNKNIKSFSQDGIHDGAYGVPFREQISYVIQTLKNDCDTRQAIMTFWRWNPRPSKDVPCTISLHFLIRNNKLNLNVLMRSNDIIWGNNYDVPSFCMLLNFVASCIGISPGDLYLTANSMHLYEQHFEMARRLIDEESSSASLPLLTPASLEVNLDAIDTISMYESYLRAQLDNDFTMPTLSADYWNMFLSIFALKDSLSNSQRMKSELTVISEYSKELGEFLFEKYKDKLIP